LLKGAAATIGVAGAAAFAGSETVFRHEPNAVSSPLTPQPVGPLKPITRPATQVDLGATKYGAKGDGADDSIAIQSWRTDILATLDGGANGVYATVPNGVFTFGPSVTLDILGDNVHLQGDSRGGSVLRQLPGRNIDLLTTRGYAVGSGPVSGFSVSDITIDGNAGQQSQPTWCCRVRGFNYDIEHVDLLNGGAGALSSEFVDTGVTKYSEARIHGLGCHEYLGVPGTQDPTYGILWGGPHDSQFSDVILSTLAAAQPGGGSSYGFVQTKGAAAEYITNLHVWGRHHYGIWADPLAYGIHLANVVAEGGFMANAVLGSHCSWAGGETFGTQGNSGRQALEIGISLGLAGGAPHAPPASGTTDGFSCTNTIVQAVRSWNFAAPGACVDFSHSGGGNFLTVLCGTEGSDARPALYRGSPRSDDEVYLADPNANLRFIQRLSST
jgi:hypothetical protein